MTSLKKEFLETLASYIRLTDEDMFEKMLTAFPNAITDREYYIYHEGNLDKYPVVLVVHTDTVRGEVNYPIKLALAEQMFLINTNGILGADDRAGIAMVDILRKSNPDISVLFCNFEEIGSKGASELLRDIDREIIPSDIFDKVKLFIGLDRQGVDHYVTYHYLPFAIENILLDLGLLNRVGSFSDTYILTEYMNIPSINMAIGYHKEHTEEEYLDYEEWLVSLGKVKDILNISQKLPLIRLEDEL